MTSLRRIPLVAVLLLALVGVGTASTLEKSHNAIASSNSLSISQKVESTALYCTGLTGTKGDAQGRVTFLNTSDQVRALNIEVVSDTGQRATSSLTLSPHGTQAIQPETLAQGNYFGVAVQVNGGGVVGEEVASAVNAESPCTSAGITNWYGSGFDTTVGSSADLSIYNPTATPAVFNVTSYSTNGFAAPSPFQGLSVGAHSLLEINLGTQIVNTTNIGVHVKVLRGSIDIVGVQGSGPVTSFNAGVMALATTAWFPRVTTASGATAQIRVTNTGAVAANVVANVELSNYKVAPQSQIIAPYSSGVITITPNSAIPAAGYGTVTFTSNVPVATSLATGTSGTIALSAPVAPSNSFLIADFSGKGFDASTVTNTSSKALTVTFSSLVGAGQHGATSSTQLDADSTENILSLFSGLTSLKGVTLLITSSKPTLVVTTTLPTTPAGTTVVAPLDGR